MGGRCGARLGMKWWCGGGGGEEAEHRRLPSRRHPAGRRDIRTPGHVGPGGEHFLAGKACVGVEAETPAWVLPGLIGQCSIIRVYRPDSVPPPAPPVRRRRLLPSPPGTGESLLSASPGPARETRPGRCLIIAQRWQPSLLRMDDGACSDGGGWRHSGRLARSRRDRPSCQRLSREGRPDSSPARPGPKAHWTGPRAGCFGEFGGGGSFFSRARHHRSHALRARPVGRVGGARLDARDRDSQRECPWGGGGRQS